MAGASREHVTIVANLAYLLVGQFKGRPCMAFTNDMRLKVTETGLYTYPGVAALCSEPEFEDSEQDTLTNPSLIIEVLSDSTERYDRGDKFAHYRRLTSLQTMCWWNTSPDTVRSGSFAWRKGWRPVCHCPLWAVSSRWQTFMTK